ncbi:protein ROLLING AND ERECT LEAF 2-like [Tasmannia lanceolata]|uniref:protein ROLLING AND ERECT LEAF 2-like n=1 Tax=Tasmannia lanceolata TaxID=3420 RepID=UPI0040643DDE
MGCSASKFDNEHPVRRCEDRWRLMKQVVYSRRHLASAHSNYLQSLLLMGSSLSQCLSSSPHLEASMSDFPSPTTLPSHIFSNSNDIPTASLKNRKYSHLPANSNDLSSSSVAWHWQDYPPPSAPPYEESSCSSSSKSVLLEARPDIDLAETSETGTPTADVEFSNPMNVVGHRDLINFKDEINKNFIKAAEAGGPVSDLLETDRAQFNQNFRQLKKAVYLSSSVLSNPPPLAVKYRPDTGEASGTRKSHYSTLETLHAWEEKLYDKVKAREKVKIKHQKKLSDLQNQEYMGVEDAKLDETNAVVKTFQSLLTVTSQAVSTTSSAINKVRDDELAPQLVELCHG